jgi:hypothetical protein
MFMAVYTILRENGKNNIPQKALPFNQGAPIRESKSIDKKTRPNPLIRSSVVFPQMTEKGRGVIQILTQETD